MIEFKIPSYVTKALGLLEKGGFEGFLVGGCVRDSAMGLSPHDFDIATNALPEQTMLCFPQHKAIENAVRHGTVLVIVDAVPLEVTTYRTDGTYSDNRHPEKVSFLLDIRSDLSRRDFTVNAMAYSPSRGLIDPFGGLADIAAERISCVGEPDVRFGEDALRIMRALRFSATLGFTVEERTARSVFENSALLGNISAERKYSELSQLVCGKNAGDVLLRYSSAMSSLIAFSAVRQELLSRMLPLVKPEKILRLAAVFLSSKLETGGSPLPDFAAVTLAALKAEKAVTNGVRLLLELNEKAPPVPGEAELKKLAGSCGVQPVLDMLHLRAALAGATDDTQAANAVHRLSATVKRFVSENACISVSQLAVTGNDLKAFGVAGQQTGALLEKMLGDVIDGRASNNREELLARYFSGIS